MAAASSSGTTSVAGPFQYYVPWKSSSQHYGGHRGNQRGMGIEYRGNLTLVDYPDVRRIDLRQTLRDPYEQVQVRLFNQDNITPLFAVCDLSSSMLFKGQARKLDKAAQIATSIARSAYQMGDLFSLVSYHQHVVEELSMPLGLQIQQAEELLATMTAHDAPGLGCEGILDVPQYLSQSKALVFWISDFHMPLSLIEQSLNMLSQHQVVPIVLWEAREYTSLPRFGFGNLLDPETGRERTIFFREALRQRFIEAFEARRQTLQDLFLRFDSPPLFIQQAYSPEAVTQYFEQYMRS